ncbi:MAG: TonB-dependent receptor [Bacteroidota bacterium]
MNFIKLLASLLLFLFALPNSYAQEFILSGTVTAADDKQPVLGVDIVIEELETGTSTDFDGKYEIELPEGTHTIKYTYIGFKDEIITLTITENTTQNIELETSSESLDEVVITKSIEKTEIRSTQMSANSLKSETIKKIPAVLGEPDVIRSLIQLPGVSNAGEGASGFNVRGGSADQNLVLIDNATIFNSSHLFGLFSVFNPDAIKDLTLYKGGIPAKFGGRVSSVLDIQQRSGSKENFKGEASLGLVSSKLLLEGPIEKGKSSFLISGRGSYAHLFLGLADNPNSAYFYDVNAKFNFELNENNRILVSTYFGRDVFDINDNFQNVYGSTYLSTRWNHIFNEDIYSNLSLVFNDYLFNLNLNSVGFEFDSGVRNIDLKYSLNHIINDNLNLDYGIESLLHEFNPATIRPNRPDSGIIERQLTKKYAWENGLFISANQDITEDLSASLGLRVSSFFRLGQDEINVYENNNPIIYNENLGVYEQAEPIDVQSASRSSVLKSYHNLEPRFSLSYALNNDNSIKASYNRMVQNLHLITNASAPTPFDIWAPSGEFIKPQKLDQYAVGYFSNFAEDNYSIETEVFYKTIQNSLDFVDGANLIANDAIEREILAGEGRAYGWEFLLKKNTGKLTGWIAYTLSRSEQRTPGRTAAEPGVNNGNWYLNSFDKTHDLSIVANYELSKKWEFNANMILQTGQPVNFPVGQYQYQDLTIPVFEGRNKNRLPTYHRIDLAATLTPERNENQKWESSWTFSIYNVYNRMNAAAIIFNQDQQTGANQARRLAIFGAVPSVSYNIKF